MGWQRLKVKKAADSENRNVPTFRNIPMNHRGKREPKRATRGAEKCVQKWEDET